MEAATNPVNYGAFGVNLIFTLAGLLAFLTAVVSIGALVHAGKWKRKFYVIYIAMSSNDALMGLVYGGTGLPEAYHAVFASNETLTYEECCSKSALPYFVQCFGLYIVVMITLDRYVSVMAPFFYKTSCTVLHFGLPMVVSAFALTFLEVIFMLINARNQQPHSIGSFTSANPCGTASCWKPNDRYVFTLIFHLVLSSIIILANSFLFLHIIYSTLNFQHLLQAEQGQQQQPENSRKATDDSIIVDEKTNLQFEKKFDNKRRRKRNNNRLNLNNLGAVHGKIVKSLLLMIIVHVVSHFSARLILLINVLRLTAVGGNGTSSGDPASAQDPEGNWVAMYARSLVVINGAVHFFLYYNINGRFRAAVRGLFRLKC